MRAGRGQRHRMLGRGVGNYAFEKVTGAPSSGFYRGIATAEMHACAIAEDGRPTCWGGVGAGIPDLTLVVPYEDYDGDGVIGLYDCDDHNADAIYTFADADCDGVLVGDDCDDANPALGDVAADADCDAVLTGDDCDDTDATLGALALDGDCDGLLTSEDCDDADATATAVADADCDGVLTADDCDDSNVYAASTVDDADCDSSTPPSIVMTGTRAAGSSASRLGWAGIMAASRARPVVRSRVGGSVMAAPRLWSGD